MRYLKFLLIGLIAVSNFSCIDEEGEGGISEIHGYVYKVLHPNDNFELEADTFPAAKEDVYIVYGDEPIYGDKMETGYDGYYRFKYLNKGTYKVYAYNTLQNTQKVAVIDSVTIDKGQSVQVNNIYIHEGKSYETSYIKGSVRVIYYNKTSQVTLSKGAFEVRMYIKKKGAAYYFDEARTSWDGTGWDGTTLADTGTVDGIFMFKNLEPGDYEIYTYTEDRVTEALSPVIKSVTITEKGTIETIDEPFNIILHV